MFPQWVSRDRIMEPFRSAKTLKSIRSCSINLQMNESCRNLRYTPGLPSISHRCLRHMFKHSRYQECGCLWELRFHLRDHKGNVFGEQESVSTSVLVVMPWTAETEVRHTDTDTGFVLPWKQSLISQGNSCEICPRDSKPLSCYLVAKGIESRTPASLCIKYRGILLCYFNLHT